MPFVSDKARLRAWARGRRAELPDVSAALSAHLAAWLRGRGATRVLAYRAFDGEPDVGILSSQFELYTTRAHWRPQPHLTLHAWDSATQRNRLGILEPPVGTPEIEPERAQVVLVPGLAFDRAGVRLGYGGGFYDRLLPRLGAVFVGVIQRELWLEELPAEPHDVRMHFLATQDGVTPVS